jgi:hypothetical protein
MAAARVGAVGVHATRGKIDQRPGESLADCGAPCRTKLVAVHALGLPQHPFKSGPPRVLTDAKSAAVALTFTISARPVIGDLVITTRPERPHRDRRRHIALGQGCRPCTPLLCRVPDSGACAQLRKPSTEITRIGSTIDAYGSSASLSGSEVFGIPRTVQRG